jgi:hypothetical protein
VIAAFAAVFRRSSWRESCTDALRLQLTRIEEDPMMTARISLLALLALTGCVGVASTEGAVAALECGADQVCPDGRACPDDGVCEAPEGGECACADDTDEELCERWLDWCRDEDQDRDPADDGEQDCDDEHERGGACEELQAGCQQGDAQACEIWERECRDEDVPGECRCDCPDGAEDDVNCVCECDPAAGDCRELAARCEQGEAEACAAWEQQCSDDPDPDQCPCDCQDNDQAGADCRCECDPAGDVCQELAAGCERGDAEACAAWEQQCFDDGNDADDAHQDPAVACEELRDRCAAGNQEACAALEQQCPDVDRP